MIIVDRTSFIAFLDGVILHRMRRGMVIMPSEVLCMRAEKAAQNGEKIGLTVNGELFSTMQSDGESIQETAIDKTDKNRNRSTIQTRRKHK